MAYGRFRRVRRGVGIVLGGLLAVFVLLVSVAAAGWQRRFEVPRSTLRASTDPVVIEKGRRLAYGAARCAECHVNRQEAEAVARGETPELAGGFAFPSPIATFVAPNITPDVETGIGSRSDADLVGIIRHGVLPDGKALIPFMEYQQLSDDDLVALISFLRSQPPVSRRNPTHDFNLIGQVVRSYVLEPAKGDAPPPAVAPAEEPTVERGAYVANAVALCASCHTARSETDGSFLGPKFAGGGRFEVEGDPSMVFVSPNLTPAEHGWIAKWSEDQFVGRFRSGVGLPGTPMPWRLFSRMSEDDLRGIYRYLRSLPPVETEQLPTLRTKET